MSFTSVFKNFGHAIATTAKAFVGFAADAEKALLAVSAQQPVVDGLLGLVNPKATGYSDLAFHVLGDVAAAVEAAGGAVASSGLNLTLDASVIAAIKSLVADVKAIHGAAVPAPTTATTPIK